MLELVTTIVYSLEVRIVHIFLIPPVRKREKWMGFCGIKKGKKERKKDYWLKLSTWSRYGSDQTTYVLH